MTGFQSDCCNVRNDTGVSSAWGQGSDSCLGDPPAMRRPARSALACKPMPREPRASRRTPTAMAGAVNIAVKAQPGAAAAARVAPLSLAPLNATSLRTQVYALLKAAIADTDIYNPQQELRLDERQLITALGVSRTPIREALSLLEQEGFIRTMPRRGIFIVRKSKREIIEMIQMWAALESRGWRPCTHRMRRSPNYGTCSMSSCTRPRPSTWTNIPMPTSRFTPR
jgi:DNA-binding transcriptional regulator YhcF (GntR family)